MTKLKLAITSKSARMCFSSSEKLSLSAHFDLSLFSPKTTICQSSEVIWRCYSETTDYPIVSIFIEGIWGEERERDAATLRALGDEMDKIVYERQSAAELAQRSAIAPATYRQKLHQLNAREMELKQQQTRLAKSHAVKEAEKLKAMLPREQITVFDEVLFGGIVECVEIQSREFITFELKCGLRLTEWFQLSPFAPSVSTTSAPIPSALFPPTTT